jgi:hypothetical protein
MNIFALDADPVLAAQYHCDRHVIKMVLETAQMLSSAHRIHGSTVDALYRATHLKHPISKWINTSAENYQWGYDLFVALAAEYELRYHRVHGSYRLLNHVLCHIPDGIESSVLTPWVQCMPEIYRGEDPVQAYRQYYLECKLKMSTWRREMPFWVQEHLAKQSTNL